MCPLAGLTGLRSLQLQMNEEHWPLVAAQWDAIAAMPNLQQLACDVRTSDVAQLRRLNIRGLRTLEVVLYGGAAQGGKVFDLGAVLDGIGCSFPCLKALQINILSLYIDDTPSRVSHAALFRFVHSLHLLEKFFLLCYDELTCSQVCALALHSSLRVLALPFTMATDELRLAVTGHGERGLRIITGVDGSLPWGVFDDSSPLELG